jgi:outer membrane immunogenic protein
VAVAYDHVFMGTDNVNLTSTGVRSPAGTLSRDFTIHQDLDMATARVNYRFGAPVIGGY